MVEEFIDDGSGCVPKDYNLDFVRVDLYDAGRRIHFGELTSTPGCGAEGFEPRSMDEHLGQLWGRGLTSVRDPRRIERSVGRPAGGCP